MKAESLASQQQGCSFPGQSEQEEAVQTVDMSHTQLLRMLDQIPVGVMLLDPKTLCISYYNQTSRKILEKISDLLPVEVDSLLGVNVDIFHKNPEQQRALLLDAAMPHHQARIHLGPEILDLSVSRVFGPNGVDYGPMLTWSLVTAQVRAEEHVFRLANYDMLTGLHNRAAFMERLETVLSDMNIDDKADECAMMFVDLDGFKMVNDTYGHATGDLMLTHVAEVLGTICRKAGVFLARLGGDEFAVIVQNATVEQVGGLAGRIIDAFEYPFVLPTGHQHQMGASVGIAFSPEHGTQSSLLLSRADMALYAAKAGGKKTARVFLPQMEDSVLMRARLERMLRDAFVHSRDMFVFYQPIVDLTSGQVVSREALMRWYDSSRGWIPPKDFIPVAEEAGLVYDLDSFVLHAACRDAAIWADEASVAVNISAASVGQGRLPGAVAMALAASGLPAARLSVEITETALMSGGNEALRDLQALRDMGVGISLDDFGTGFSSLAHLRAFPFDRIKIDGSFVQDGDRRSDCAAIVRALAQLGVTLRVATVAEGVETPQQRQRIQADGCTHAQGYLFGRPEPALRDLSRLKAINALHVC